MGDVVTKAGANRLQLLGIAAILTVGDAAELMPGGYARRVAWLHAVGLVKDLDGDQVVVWGDVLEKLRNERTVATKKPGTEKKTTVRWNALREELDP